MHFLACKGALDASSRDLDGGVRCAAVAHVLEEKELFCREMGLLPRVKFVCREIKCREIGSESCRITLELLWWSHRMKTIQGKQTRPSPPWARP